MAETSKQRVWRPSWPCQVRQVLGQQRRGVGDPTYRVRGEQVWRGVRTPLGPASLMVEARDPMSQVYAEAWGPGAEWILDAVSALLGDCDDWSGFEPRHPVLAQARRHHPHARLGRTGLILEALVPAIIEQKVTGQEAFSGFGALVRRFGERAPGPGGEIGLRVQPTPETLRGLASWEWLALHIDPARSRTIVGVARVAESIERLSERPIGDVDRALRSLPGVGVWTSAETRQRALGDPDAVSFGDYHVAKDVGWALTGTPFDDDELAAYLEPWRPQRGRVPALVSLAGLHRPRHGPRMSPRRHLPARTPGM